MKFSYYIAAAMLVASGEKATRSHKKTMSKKYKTNQTRHFMRQSGFSPRSRQYVIKYFLNVFQK
jgi:hypothetical protein